MLEKIPSNEEMRDLLGVEKFNAWQAVCSLVDSLYEMDTLWNSGGKNWIYEYKYRRGGKTLCALYARDNCFGILIIFGKIEREKFENEKDTYSSIIQDIYANSTTYHDGKWMMIEPSDLTLLDDIEKLLRIKRKPNKK